MSNKISSSDRSALIRLASELPEGSEERRAILSGLSRVGMEFDTKEALEKYLKDHPGADKSLHSVKKEEGGGGGGSKKIDRKKETSNFIKELNMSSQGSGLPKLKATPKIEEMLGDLMEKGFSWEKMIAALDDGYDPGEESNFFVIEGFTEFWKHLNKGL